MARVNPGIVRDTYTAWRLGSIAKRASLDEWLRDRRPEPLAFHDAGPGHTRVARG